MSGAGEKMGQALPGSNSKARARARIARTETVENIVAGPVDDLCAPQGRLDRLTNG